MALFSAQLAALFPKASPETLSRPFWQAQRSACLGVFQWMHKNKVTCAQDASDSCRYSVLIRNGGPGQVRTGDLEFRKLSLYPSELQPRSSIVILPGRFVPPAFVIARGTGSTRWRQSPGCAAQGVVGAGFDFVPGAILVMRRLRKIVGQYSRSALLAVYDPMRIPYRWNVRPAVCSFAGK